MDLATLAIKVKHVSGFCNWSSYTNGMVASSLLSEPLALKAPWVSVLSAEGRDPK